MPHSQMNLVTCYYPKNPHLFVYLRKLVSASGCYWQSCWVWQKCIATIHAFLTYSLWLNIHPSFSLTIAIDSQKKNAELFAFWFLYSRKRDLCFVVFSKKNNIKCMYTKMVRLRFGNYFLWRIHKLNCHNLYYVEYWVV